MIEINLLPVKEIKALLQARKQVLGFIVSFVALLAVLAFLGMMLVFKVDDLKARVSDLEKEKKIFQHTIDQIEKLKADRAKLDAKLDTIKKLKTGSLLPVRVLDEISSLTPIDRLWINNFTYGNNVLNISGIGLDDATIAQYMQTITASPFFASAELSGTSSTSIGGSSLKTFQLTIGVVNPPPPDNGEETGEEAGSDKK